MLAANFSWKAVETHRALDIGLVLYLPHEPEAHASPRFLSNPDNRGASCHMKKLRN